MGWVAGGQPHLRRGGVPSLAPVRDGEGAECYFCGERTVKLSVGDVSGDWGRLEAYCENQSCEARTMAVLVLRDTHGAQQRADVRGLFAIDCPNGMPTSGTLSQLMAEREGESPREIVARRTSKEPLNIDVP